MPDHVHLLITPASDVAIERCAQLIKGGFSFAVRKEHPGDIWQEGYHAHRIVDTEDLQNQTSYILNNPGRKRMDAYPWVSSSSAYNSRMDEIPTA
jgi:putative transposase